MIRFREAQKRLEERLEASVEEVAVWVLTGMLPAYDENRRDELVVGNGALLEGLYQMTPQADPRRTLFKALAGALFDPDEVESFDPQAAARRLTDHHAEVDDANPSGRFLPGPLAAERVAELTDEDEPKDRLSEWLGQSTLDYFPLAYAEPEWAPAPEELGWVVIGKDELGEMVSAEFDLPSPRADAALTERMRQAAEDERDQGGDPTAQRAAAIGVLAQAAQEVHGEGTAPLPAPKDAMAGLAAELLPELFQDPNYGNRLDSSPGGSFSKAARGAGLTFSSHPDRAYAEGFWAQLRRT